jgi:hypothetical protein
MSKHNRDRRRQKAAQKAQEAAEVIQSAPQILTDAKAVLAALPTLPEDLAVLLVAVMVEAKHARQAEPEDAAGRSDDELVCLVLVNLADRQRHLRTAEAARQILKLLADRGMEEARKSLKVVTCLDRSNSWHVLEAMNRGDIDPQFVKDLAKDLLLPELAEAATLYKELHALGRAEGDTDPDSVTGHPDLDELFQRLGRSRDGDEATRKELVRQIEELFTAKLRANPDDPRLSALANGVIRHRRSVAERN